MSLLAAAHRRNAGGGGGSSVNRFYFPGTGSPSISPSTMSGWTGTAQLVRRPLAATRSNTSFEVASIGGGSISHELGRQFVSAALAAQTISGTAKSYLRAYRTGNRSCWVSLGISVVNSSGTIVATLRAVALAHADQGGGYGLTASAKNTPLTTSMSLSAYSCAAGDRLVVEIGKSQTATWGSGAVNGNFDFGDDNATDLPENNTETNNYNPWIEFSNAILLL